MENGETDLFKDIATGVCATACQSQPNDFKVLNGSTNPSVDQVCLRPICEAWNSYVDFRDRWGTQKPFFLYGAGRTPVAVPHPRKWLQSRSPKATTLEFCSKFRAQPVQRGPGADLGHKRPKTAKN